MSKGVVPPPSSFLWWLCLSSSFFIGIFSNFCWFVSSTQWKGKIFSFLQDQRGHIWSSAILKWQKTTKETFHIRGSLCPMRIRLIGIDQCDQSGIAICSLCSNKAILINLKMLKKHKSSQLRKIRICIFSASNDLASLFSHTGQWEEKRGKTSGWLFNWFLWPDDDLIDRMGPINTIYTHCLLWSLTRDKFHRYHVWTHWLNCLYLEAFFCVCVPYRW